MILFYLGICSPSTPSVLLEINRVGILQFGLFGILGMVSFSLAKYQIGGLQSTKSDPFRGVYAYFMNDLWIQWDVLLNDRLLFVIVGVVFLCVLFLD